MRTLQDIQDFIGDKPIVIIGNKEPVREKEYKDVIVFRMNLGYRDDHDVWINNLAEACIKKENLDISQHSKYILRLCGEDFGVRLQHYPEYMKEYTYEWDLRDYQVMCQETKMTFPTAGFVSIYWAINNLENKIYIDEFDFFMTPNRYTKREFRHKEYWGARHNPFKEKQIIQQYIEDDLIEWYQE